MFRIYPMSTEFESIFDDITSKAFNQDDVYPPYNIFTEGDKGIIEIACTGMDESNLKAYFDDGFLIVEGKHPEQNNRVYNHKGLSTKDFRKKFRLEKNWEVKEIDVVNGLMQITLEQNKPEKQLIPINKSNALEQPKEDKTDKTDKTDKEGSE